MVALSHHSHRRGETSPSGAGTGHLGDAEVSALWSVYDAVFADLPDEATWRTRTWGPHSSRDGFRLERVWADDRLVGFAYGYTGGPGQYWTELLRDHLDATLAEAWLDGHFELVELAVLADQRGRGLGRALLHRLTADLPHERWLLMTSDDPADPARRLYEAEGWQVLADGPVAGTVVLGRAAGKPERRPG